MRATVVVLALLAQLAGCGEAPDGLTVLAASSLQAVATELLDATGTAGEVSAAGSHVLAAQVRAGSPGDVLLLADPELAADLENAGLAGPPTVVASTVPVIVVAPGAGDRVVRPEDLADPGLRVVLGDADVPLGRATRDAFGALEDAGGVPPGTLDRVLDGADSFEAEAALVVLKLTSGEADAVVVYASDLVGLQGQVHVVPLPDAPTVRYTAQVLTGAAHPERARDLVRALTDPGASATWQRFGFAPPP